MQVFEAGLRARSCLQLGWVEHTASRLGRQRLAERFLCLTAADDQHQLRVHIVVAVCVAVLGMTVLVSVIRMAVLVTVLVVLAAVAVLVDHLRTGSGAHGRAAPPRLGAANPAGRRRHPTAGRGV
eukprot:7386773-Prymnesium_polylepis.1